MFGEWSLETERLAWVLLRTAHRTQAEGSTARLVVPRNPETVNELGRGLAPTPTDDDLLTAEEYLEEHGYLQAIRPGTAPLFAPREMPPDLSWRLFSLGLVTNLLYPKIAVLYFSLLPQFVDPKRGAGLAQSLALDLTQIVVSLAVNGCIVLGAAPVVRVLGVGWEGRIVSD